MDGGRELQASGRTGIRQKLGLGLLSVAAIPLIGMAVAFYWTSKQLVEQAAFDRLSVERDAAARELAAAFAALHEDIRRAVGDASLAAAAERLRTGIASKRWSLDELRAALRERAAERTTAESSVWRDPADRRAESERQAAPGPAPNGLLDDDGRSDEGERAELHKIVGDVWDACAALVARAHVDDVMIVGSAGEVLFEMRPDADPGRRVIEDTDADTALAQVIRASQGGERTLRVAMSDFVVDGTRAGDPVAYVAAPLRSAERVVGVLVGTVRQSRLEELLTERRFGETGAVLVIGPDGRVRAATISGDEGQTARLLRRAGLPIRNEAVRLALKGQHGIGLVTSFRGYPALASWGPVTVHPGYPGHSRPIRWAVVSELSAAEVHAPLRRVIDTVLLIAGAAAAAVLLVSMIVTRSFTRQTRSIMKMLQAVAQGDFDARAEVINDDELGTVAEALNRMCDNTLSLIQSREERERLEQAVLKLKQQVATIASGDLTVEAEVDDSLTGEIAQSVNEMVEQLREIIENVKQSTRLVSRAADEIQQTTEHLSLGAEVQSNQITQTKQSVDAMTTSIEAVSRNAGECDQVADRARRSAVAGSEAVQNTIAGMNRIRQKVQDTAKRIKRLGETSQEVGEIVQLISDIADRTSILALNASIQAAMAGEAGEGFAMVAEEVERLADRSHQATRQIESLIKAIQGDTSEAIAAMEDCTREVVEGSRLAADAGGRLEEIDQVSQQLAELIHMISAATQEQAAEANAIAEAMQEIAGVTEETTTGAREAASAAKHLATLAESLSASVSTFLLPESGDTSAGGESIFDEFQDDEDSLEKEVWRLSSGILRKGRGLLSQLRESAR
ncbi:MAG: methyl-accepting chemotaxis protein [Planctomycetota bacterium]|nr:MAG: methyl-accepting chemotaxis protein [Planctomycetota bacterium]